MGRLFHCGALILLEPSSEGHFCRLEAAQSPVVAHGEAGSDSGTLRGDKGSYRLSEDCGCRPSVCRGRGGGGEETFLGSPKRLAWAGPGAGGAGWAFWSMHHDGAASPRAPPVPGAGFTLADDPELLLSLLGHAPAGQCLIRLDFWAWRGSLWRRAPSLPETSEVGPSGKGPLQCQRGSSASAD